MKAIVHHKYGEPEEALLLQDVDTPVVGDDDVLVRVRAASLHIGDYHLVRGVPYFLRLAFGLRTPKNPVAGVDIAGQVEAVGAGVQAFQVGDEVMGWCRGGFAELAAAAANQFVAMPTTLTFEEASTVGVSAMTALQALRDKGEVQPGQKVLVNGASGGVGTFAVQIAKALGAEVTGVCSTRNVELVRSIGADHVIDYTQADFIEGTERYDLILDNVCNRSLSDCRRPLAPDGLLLPNGGSPGRWLGGTDRMLKAIIVSLFKSQQGRPFLSLPAREDLLALKELVEAGKLAPAIDRTYPLIETPQAMAYLGQGHAQAKVVIVVPGDESGSV